MASIRKMSKQVSRGSPNMRSESEIYKAAGVDITAGYRAVELMKAHIKRTKNEALSMTSAASAACSFRPWPA